MQAIPTSLLRNVEQMMTLLRVIRLLLALGCEVAGDCLLEWSQRLVSDVDVGLSGV